MALYHHCCPSTLSDDQVQDYLNYCKNQHQTPSESFFKHTIYGLRSAYKVLNLPDKKIALPQIKRQNKLPIILNYDETRQLLCAPKYLRHRMMLAVLYGCGLRSYELCNILLSEVDVERKTILIRQQKGRFDRYLPLGDHLSRGLEKYIDICNPSKFLFNSQVSPDSDPRPITVRTIQWLIKECCSKVDTHKHFTAHTLRHTYATHLIEQGLNILTIQQLLGHARIETTLIYLHVAQNENSPKYSPLDKLFNW